MAWHSIVRLDCTV